MAERLFIEHGSVHAAGREFGSPAALVRTVVRDHGKHVEHRRERMVAALAPDAGVRDWVACLVHPYTGHLAALDPPTWCARLCAQAMTDPVLRHVLLEEAMTSPALRQAVDGLARCQPDLPLPAHLERGAMTRTLIAHTCADRERELPASSTWAETADGLVAAITGLWQAPVTRRERP